MSSCPPLTKQSVEEAYERIKGYIHRTPVLTSSTLSARASTPQDESVLRGTPWQDQAPARPRMELFFKAENFQRVGAFKSRGAFHSLSRLSADQLQRGVITNSSGNHAQALALAAKTFNVPAYVVMPHISMPAKIEATKGYGAQVIFSGSTSQERIEKMNELMQETGATYVPPYDHPNTILGQGTMGLEAVLQIEQIFKSRESAVVGQALKEPQEIQGQARLDAIIAPCGGGGMLSGIALSVAGTGIKVFGAEPSYQGANDAETGIAAGKRVEKVKTLTIADGLRTPLGKLNWGIISDPSMVHGIFSVTEGEIKAAMKLVLERMKIVIEPSGAVALAVVLFNEKFRKMVEEQAGNTGWRICVVLSGGNTTVEAMADLFN